MNPRVSQVDTSPDYQLKLTFTNGEHGTYDCAHLLEFAVFQELKDTCYFK